MNALRTGEVAEAAGVNRETLRYYERVGLLARPERSLGGHRLYPRETVSVIRTIKAAQRLGFTLDEVAELLAVGSRRPGLRERAEVKLGEVEAKIADLEVVRDTLRAAISAGCDDLVACSHTPSCPLPFVGLAVSGEGSCC
ncbi:DNA-binding transcriptional regulator, MerR family [Lentzea waywayandensis]|uniref:DNA-binding transcriptional regulator, MerR family n=1 Tax=Lentzea waywayandensis TaxID=84724 RepID=A0A1I6DGK1_9PSEU|nr:MerR family transcriptional regulator [Lentzea waywayandensis]SFR04564.1 DNA-binding transcriptional regulator, MerR family [Lentzea waywayandensis]